MAKHRIFNTVLETMQIVTNIVIIIKQIPSLPVLRGESPFKPTSNSFFAIVPQNKQPINVFFQLLLQ